MRHWIRFEHRKKVGFGTLKGDVITVWSGDMFKAPKKTARMVKLAAVTVLAPCQPSKMLALWNNFRALAQKTGQPEPPEPLYLLKAPSSFIGTGAVIHRPKSFDGRVVFEGEIGIVIGKRCKAVSVEDAPRHIFGYTCINDVTAAEIINKDPTFAQWVRSKSYDGFGAFGPVIAQGLDPSGLSIRTVLNGAERQNYPVADMIHPPARIVSAVSQDMTLMPGDVICCGTSVGVGAMREPRNTVEVTIEGIGTLSNIYVQ